MQRCVVLDTYPTLQYPIKIGMSLNGTHDLQLFNSAKMVVWADFYPFAVRLMSVFCPQYFAVFWWTSESSWWHQLKPLGYRGQPKWARKQYFLFSVIFACFVYLILHHWRFPFANDGDLFTNKVIWIRCLFLIHCMSRIFDVTKVYSEEPVHNYPRAPILLRCQDIHWLSFISNQETSKLGMSSKWKMGF